MQKNNQSRTFFLAATALLTAISLILGQFKFYIPLFGFPSVRFSISGIPVFLAGSLFGPIYGAGAGFASDIISFILSGAGAGPFHPGFTLNSVLVGVIPGVFFSIIKNKKTNISFGKINSVLSLIALVGAIIYINFIGIHKVENLGTFIGIPTNIILTIFMIVLVGALNFIFIKIRNVYGDKDELYSIDKITFVACISYIVIQLILTPIWVKNLYGMPIMASVIVRIFKCLIDVPLQVMLKYFILKMIPLRIKRAAYE